MIELIHGDCLEEMGKLSPGSVDMVLCDMPYGTTRCRWDTPLYLPRVWELLSRVVKKNGAILLFAQTPFDKILGASNIQDLRYEWIWEKTAATGHLNAKKIPMKAHENILVFYQTLPTYNPQKTHNHKPVNSYTKYLDTQNKPGVYGLATKEVSGGGNTDRYPRSVLKFKSDKQKIKLHPTQKPVDLLRYFIRTYSDSGDTILDFCAGSGSTGVAAEAESRNCILIEKYDHYVEVIRERLNKRGL